MHQQPRRQDPNLVYLWTEALSDQPPFKLQYRDLDGFFPHFSVDEGKSSLA